MTKTSTKRKAISKKEDIKLPKDWGKVRDPETGELVNFNQAMDDHLKYDSKGYREWDDEADAQGTVEQIKNAGKWLGQDEYKINYWKYACIAILLGLVAGMILSAPLFVKLAVVCSL